MKKITLGVLAFMLIGLMAVGAVSAFSGWGRNAAVDEALESGDYSTWKSAMIEGLSEERFEQMRERHGEISEHRAEMEQHREEMQAAVEGGDYETWVALHESKPRTPPFELTQENFDLFVQMHFAQQDGDYETAQELREELGLGERGPGMGFGGKGHGMGRCGIDRGGFGECQNAD